MTNSWKNDRIERELSSSTVPEPPESLLTLLKEEIPQDLSAASRPPAPSSMPAARRWQLVAATLFLGVVGLVIVGRIDDGSLAPEGRAAPEGPAASEERAVSERRAETDEARQQVATPTVPDPELAAPVAVKQGMRFKAAAPPVAGAPVSADSEPPTAAELQKVRDGLASRLQPLEEARARAGVASTPGEAAGGRVDADVRVDADGNDDRGNPSPVAEVPKPKRVPTASEKKESSVEGEDQIAVSLADPAPMDPGKGMVREPRPAAPAPAPPPPSNARVEPRNRRLSELEREKARLEQELRSVGSVDTAAAPSTGGTTEPNDRPYGDMFFESAGVNPFVDTEDDRLSTFGLDVDTGSYTMSRSYLERGHRPPADAVRVEEFVNFFSYGDRPPSRGDFALVADGAPSPFAEGPRYQVVRFGVHGRVIDRDERRPAGLVFVIDVSGSMEREDRLGLVKRSLYLLLDELTPRDRVGLVVYGSSGRVLLAPTSDHEAIRSAIGRLRSGGATNAEEGLVLGYELARRHFREDASNRVILCSDGVANVGRTGPDSILTRIEAAAEEGIELTTVGFGMGNYNDVLMERLADRGDGRYAYVDTLGEARRLFVDDLTGTLETIATDAKVQVEFNPKAVSRYRLLGYENRDIADELFRDDTVDAGEIGAGHQVSAVYEVKLTPEARGRDLLARLSLRYHSLEAGEVEEIGIDLRVRDLARSWREAPAALRLASVVAEFAEILRGSYWAREGDLDDLLRRAQELSPAFAGDGKVAELVGLIAKARAVGD